MLVASRFMGSVSAGCKGEDRVWSSSGLHWGRVSFRRRGHELATAAPSVPVDMLKANILFQLRKDGDRANCGRLCCDDFSAALAAPLPPSLRPSLCPGCGSRMQRASLQPQPIRAQRYTTHCCYPTQHSQVHQQLIDFNNECPLWHLFTLLQLDCGLCPQKWVQFIVLHFLTLNTKLFHSASRM